MNAIFTINRFEITDEMRAANAALNPNVRPAVVGLEIACLGVVMRVHVPYEVTDLEATKYVIEHFFAIFADREMRERIARGVTEKEAYR
jgi:hypothetical protein